MPAYPGCYFVKVEKEGGALLTSKHSSLCSLVLSPSRLPSLSPSLTLDTSFTPSLTLSFPFFIPPLLSHLVSHFISSSFSSFSTLSFTPSFPVLPSSHFFPLILLFPPLPSILLHFSLSPSLRYTLPPSPFSFPLLHSVLLLS
ncbi:hypothetical protein OTU49_015532 [Cherax quadricarinatus]|uniref:Uncharacterized protein n=1 Tax=Cherax quadricarinatus TaxID=27406 RepID=A0AAW0XZ16_CHEQU